MFYKTRRCIPVFPNIIYPVSMFVSPTLSECNISFKGFLLCFHFAGSGKSFIDSKRGRYETKSFTPTLLGISLPCVLWAIHMPPKKLRFIKQRRETLQKSKTFCLQVFKAELLHVSRMRAAKSRERMCAGNKMPCIRSCKHT